MGNKRPAASAPTTPPPPKLDRHIGEAARLLAAFVSSPGAMQLWRELEECRVQAEAVGEREKFEAFWSYEVERSKEAPGMALQPKAVLHLALKLA